MDDRERDIEAIYRAITALEKSVTEQFGNLKLQVADLSKLPVDVAILKVASTHHAENLDRIGETVEENTDHFRKEVTSVREKAEKNNEFAIERFDSLTKSLQSVADRIEGKFSTKLDDIKKELHVLISDYDKRIAAIKAVAAAVSIGFTVLQGVIGLAVTSYANGWKTRVEESELAIRDMRKNQSGMEALIKELQQESLTRHK